MWRRPFPACHSWPKAVASASRQGHRLAQETKGRSQNRWSQRGSRLHGINRHHSPRSKQHKDAKDSPSPTAGPSQAGYETSAQTSRPMRPSSGFRFRQSHTATPHATQHPSPEHYSSPIHRGGIVSRTVALAVSTLQKRCKTKSFGLAGFKGKGWLDDATEWRVEGRWVGGSLSLCLLTSPSTLPFLALTLP